MSNSESKSYDQSAEDLLSKLRQALQRDGDFPASAKVVNELKMLASNPSTTANQVTEVILREPSLGTRVLHVVNSSFYQRKKPIMTVSQAVVQIGMRPLAELCAGLVLLQKFVPAARSGGPFAVCLKKTIVTALLTSDLGSHDPDHSKKQMTKSDEEGYLCGSFAELGALLLAYYFPKIYESALKRAETKKVPFTESLKQLTGITPLDVSIEVVEALSLPEYYKERLMNARALAEASKASADDDDPIAKNIVAAREISAVVVTANNKGALDSVLSKLNKKYGIKAEHLNKSVGDLPTLFKDHCTAIELNLPALPEFVSSYGDNPSAAIDTTDEDEDGAVDTFTQFVDEIRASVESREPTATIITSVMETMAWSLNFDRVLLLLTDSGRKKLVGRMSLGSFGKTDPRTIERPLGSEAGRYAPDAIAFSESRPVFNGDPLLDEGWPLVAIPIGYGKRALGVIYADRTDSDENELESREQAAIGLLAELLDRSVGLHSVS